MFPRDKTATRHRVVGPHIKKGLIIKLKALESLESIDLEMIMDMMLRSENCTSLFTCSHLIKLNTFTEFKEIKIPY